MRAFCFIVALLLLMGCGPTKARTAPTLPKPEPPVTITLTPKWALMRTSVHIIVHIAEHSDNRMLKLVLESESYLRSTVDDWTDGAVKPPRVLDVMFNDVFEGHYTAAAMLMRTGGQVLMASDTMCVNGPNTPCSQDGIR